MQGQDRKELIDGPGVGQALEDRSVQEVGGSEISFQAGQGLGEDFHVARGALHTLAGLGEELLRAALVRQRQVPGIEELQGALAEFLSIVVVLDGVVFGDPIGKVDELLKEVVAALLHVEQGRLAAEPRGSHDLRYKHGVVGYQGPT